MTRALLVVLPLIVCGVGRAQDAWDSTVLIRGRVVDARGLPAVGAVVSLYRIGAVQFVRYRPEFAASVSSEFQPIDALVAVGSADAEGRFEIVAPPLTGRDFAGHRLSAFSDVAGLAAVRWSAYETPGLQGYLLRLDGAGRSVDVLVDSEGRPLADVAVLRQGRSDAIGGAALAFDSVRTDGEGRFTTFDGVRSIVVETAAGVDVVRGPSLGGTGKVRRWRLRPPRAHLGLGARLDYGVGRTAVMPVEAGGSVTGRVRELDGPPLCGAAVELAAAAAPFDGSTSVRAGRVRPAGPWAETDADGVYRLRRLPAGEWRIRVGAPAHAPADGPIVRVTEGFDVGVDAVELSAGAVVVARQSDAGVQIVGLWDERPEFVLPGVGDATLDVAHGAAFGVARYRLGCVRFGRTVQVVASESPTVVVLPP